MDIVAIIPARYDAVRLPGKPLLDIDGRPVIQHVYLRTARARRISRTIVATDDRRIFDAVERFGGEAVMTSPDHPSGTDRIAEVAAGLDAEIIVNVQGDEALIDPRMIDQAVEPLLDNAAIPMATAATRISDLEELHDPNVVKVVVDQGGLALYFSRHPVPYIRDVRADEDLPAHHRFLHHIGLYVYRRDFLLRFAELAPTPLEQVEKLEQLRALENGYRIAVTETPLTSPGVDTPEDLERVRRIVAEGKGAL